MGCWERRSTGCQGTGVPDQEMLFLMKSTDFSSASLPTWQTWALLPGPPEKRQGEGCACSWPGPRPPWRMRDTSDGNVRTQTRPVLTGSLLGVCLPLCLGAGTWSPGTSPLAGAASKALCPAKLMPGIQTFSALSFYICKMGVKIIRSTLQDPWGTEGETDEQSWVLGSYPAPARRVLLCSYSQMVWSQGLFHSFNMTEGPKGLLLCGSIYWHLLHTKLKLRQNWNVY